MRWIGRMYHKLGRKWKDVPDWMGLGALGVSMMSMFAIPSLYFGLHPIAGSIAIAAFLSSTVFFTSILYYDNTERRLSRAIVAREARRAVAKAYEDSSNGRIRDRAISSILIQNYDLGKLVEGRDVKGINNKISPEDAEKMLRELGSREVTAKDMEEELEYLLHLPNASRRMAKEILANHPPVFSPEERREIEERKQQQEELKELQAFRKREKVNPIPSYVGEINKRYDALVTSWMTASEERSSAVSDLRNPKLLAFCGKMEDIESLRHDPLRIAEMRHAVQDAEELWQELNRSNKARLVGGYLNR